MGRCLRVMGHTVWYQGSWGSIRSHLFHLHPQAHERLEETKLEAVRDNNLELVQEILRDLAQLAEQSSTAAELARILQEPHFQVSSRLGCSWGAAGVQLGQATGGGAGREGEVEWKGTAGHWPMVPSLPTTSPVPPGDPRLCGLKDL